MGRETFRSISPRTVRTAAQVSAQLAEGIQPPAVQQPSLDETAQRIRDVLPDTDQYIPQTGYKVPDIGGGLYPGADLTPKYGAELFGTGTLGGAEPSIFTGTPVWDPQRGYISPEQVPLRRPSEDTAGEGTRWDSEVALRSSFYEERRLASQAAQNIFGALVDPAIIDAEMKKIWDQMERSRVANKAMADAMIADAVDAASQPYDEKLRNVGRSIDQTRGQMNDLEKITDYYMSTLVEPWERAAQAARETNGTDIRGQIAGRVAEVGRGFDVSNSNVQAYLDRIGGVPVSQRLVIEDSIRELQSPWEGLAEADGSTLAAVVDAQGVLMEKQALWGLADAQWEAEKDRFVKDAQLNDKMEMLELDRQDLVGDRARAVARTKRQADAQYRYTEQMPDRDTMLRMAVENSMDRFGLDTFGKEQYLDTFTQILQGDHPLNFKDSGEVDEEGYPIGTYERITSLTELEQALAGLDPEVAADLGDDAAILMSMFASYEEMGKQYDSRNSTYRGQGYSPAPENWALRNTPEYVARRNMVTGFKQQILSDFDVTFGGQERHISEAEGAGRHPNSDHLSGGALDFFGSMEELDRLAAELDTWPEVAGVVWRAPDHYDHVHVSFLLPGDIGGGSYVDTYNRTEADYVPAGDVPSPSQTILSDDLRSSMRRAFGVAAQ